MDHRLNEFQSQQEAFRLRLTRWLAGFMTIFLAVATIVRPLLVEMDPIFTWFGIANTLAAAAVYAAIVSGRFARRAPYLLTVIGLVLLLPLALVSGGVNSQFAVLIPLLPVFAGLIAGRWTALVMASVLAVIVLGLYGAVDRLPTVTGEPVHAAMTASRAIWLMLGLALGALFSWQFDILLSRLQNELAQQAARDPLTGLANRRALETFLEAERARAERTDSPLSLLLIDVDHFKAYNDNYGHAAGDRCLQRLAGVLERFTRQGQDLAARYGGEEFVVVLTHTDAAGAERAAEHLRRTIAELPAEGQSERAVTVTIGCVSDRALASDDTLFRRADAALYEGKSAGRNRVVMAAA